MKYSPTMLERTDVECSSRLMTPSPRWCLFSRLEKVLISLSIFDPESTLAGSFQKGSLDQEKGGCIIIQSIIIMKHMTLLIICTLRNSCWAVLDWAWRAAVLTLGKRILCCPPHTQCTGGAAVSYQGLSEDRTAVCFLLLHSAGCVGPPALPHLQQTKNLLMCSFQHYSYTHIHIIFCKAVYVDD